MLGFWPALCGKKRLPVLSTPAAKLPPFLYCVQVCRWPSVRLPAIARFGEAERHLKQCSAELTRISNRLADQMLELWPADPTHGQFTLCRPPPPTRQLFHAAAGGTAMMTA